MEAQRFRKKPVEVEAMQFTGPEAIDAIREWSGGRVAPHYGDPMPARADMLVFDANRATGAGGRWSIWVGDWVVKDSEGDFHPYKPDLFEATFYPAGGARIVLAEVGAPA